MTNPSKKYKTPESFRRALELGAVPTVHAENGELVIIPITKLANLLRADPRLFRELGVGKTQAALRFADDIGNVVFKGKHNPSLHADRWRFFVDL